MNWQDTVIKMDSKVLDKMMDDNPLLDFSFEDDYREEVLLMREAQAEISFKAGQKELADRLWKQFTKDADLGGILISLKEIREKGIE